MKSLSEIQSIINENRGSNTRAYFKNKHYVKLNKLKCRFSFSRIDTFNKIKSDMDNLLKPYKMPFIHHNIARLTTNNGTLHAIQEFNASYTYVLKFNLNKNNDETLSLVQEVYEYDENLLPVGHGIPFTDTINGSMIDDNTLENYVFCYQFWTSDHFTTATRAVIDDFNIMLYNQHGAMNDTRYGYSPFVLNMYTDPDTRYHIKVACTFTPKSSVDPIEYYEQLKRGFQHQTSITTHMYSDTIKHTKVVLTLDSNRDIKKFKLLYQDEVLSLSKKHTNTTRVSIGQYALNDKLIELYHKDKK